MESKSVVLFQSNLSNLNLFNLKASVFEVLIDSLEKTSMFQKNKKIVESVLRQKFYLYNSKFTLESLYGGIHTVVGVQFGKLVSILKSN